MGMPLSLETPIPDHSAFSSYSPSFVLDVPKGNMRDESSDEYLSKIGKVFDIVVDDLRSQMFRSE